MNVLNNIGSTISGLLMVIQQIFRDYQYAKKHRLATCLYQDGGELYEFQASITPDNKSVSPKQINQQFYIKTSYRRFPQGDTVYVCSKECPTTIDLNHWDIELNDRQKGSVLSALAYDIFRTSIFKYMTAQNKREMILLIIVFSLMALVIGLFIGAGMGASGTPV